MAYSPDTTTSLLLVKIKQLDAFVALRLFNISQHLHSWQGARILIRASNFCPLLHHVIYY